MASRYASAFPTDNISNEVRGEENVNQDQQEKTVRENEIKNKNPPNKLKLSDEIKVDHSDNSLFVI